MLGGISPPMPLAATNVVALRHKKVQKQVQPMSPLPVDVVTKVAALHHKGAKGSAAKGSTANDKTFQKVFYESWFEIGDLRIHAVSFEARTEFTAGCLDSTCGAQGDAAVQGDG